MDRGYQDLADAVILQAVKDIRGDNEYAESAKWFLKSEWCKVLSNVDGRYILTKLQEEMALKPKRVRVKRNKKTEVLCNG